MQGSILTKVILIVGSIAVLGMLGYIFLSGTTKQQTVSSRTYQQATSTIPVKDYAPNIPMSQKTTILIQTSDSSDIKYIVPTNQVDTYVKSLPEGYHVISEK